MAGTFTAQNKIRPGAYIVFQGLANTNLTSGTRGIVAIPMDLPWGDTSNLIEVTAADFSQGRTLAKIGLQASDAAIQPLREVFKNASTALVGRLNPSPVKATGVAQMSGVSVDISAKYGGTLGNTIIVACIENDATKLLELVTTVGTVEVDRQVVSSVADFVENGWITLTHSESTDPKFEVFAGVTLSGGTNGAGITADS